MSGVYCPECGSYIEELGTQFCPHCGASLSVAATTAEKPTPIQPMEVPPPPTPSAPTAMYGELGERLIAYIIDAVIIWVITAIIVFPLFNGYYVSWWFVSWLLGFLYFWILESFNNGQTLGKKLLNLRTVDEVSLEVAEAGSYFVNNLSRGSGWIIIDLLVGLIVNSTSDERKRYRILQNWSKTVVIKST
ncbi:RDD family protein [Candidatus Borrarchaeum sp.]|uniref:RDD family protein n=1 Tax=Candidatus Borrarchaeum sp. TaxID=2846742 RepID=UPI00257B1D08|nr:RDD family protein [Candidatus Borrarchaeum sp.]